MKRLEHGVDTIQGKGSSSLLQDRVGVPGMIGSVYSLGAITAEELEWPGFSSLIHQF